MSPLFATVMSSSSPSSALIVTLDSPSFATAMVPMTEPTVAVSSMSPFSAMYSPPTIHVPFASMASWSLASSAPSAVTVRPSSSPLTLSMMTELSAEKLLAAIVLSARTSMSFAVTSTAVIFEPSSRAVTVALLPAVITEEMISAGAVRVTFAPASNLESMIAVVMAATVMSSVAVMR